MSDPRLTALLEAIREGRIKESDLTAEQRQLLDLGPKPENFLQKFGQEVAIRSDPFIPDKVGEAIRGLGTGAGKVLPLATKGRFQLEEALNLPEFLRTESPDRRQEFQDVMAQREIETQPRSKTEAIAQFVGRLGGEVGLAIAGGGANLLSRGPRLAADIATGVAIGSSSPEESILGGVAELSGSDVLRRASENTVARAAVETGTVVGLDALIRNLGKLKRGDAAGTAADLVEAEDAILLGDRKGVLLQSSPPADPAIRKAASDAFGERQVVLPSQIKNEQTLYDRFLGTYMKHVDVSKPFTWLSEGLNLLPSLDPRTLGSVARRTDGHSARDWVEGMRPVLGLDDTPVTIAPQKLIDDFAHGDVEGLGYAMVAKREESLRARGLGKRLTDDQLRTGLDLYKNDSGIRQAVAGFQDYADKQLNKLRQEGVVTEDLFQKITAVSEWYAPLIRGDRKLATTLYGGNVAGVGNPLHKIDFLGGAGNEVTYLNPVIGWVENTFAFNRLIARKRLHNAVAGIGDEGLKPDLIRKLEKADLPDNLNEVTEKAVDIMGFGIKSEDRVFDGPKGSFFLKNVNKEGEESFYEIDKFLFESMRAVEPAVINSQFWKTMIAPGRTLRAGVVITPGFAGGNVFRDGVLRAFGLDPTLSKNPTAILEAFSGGIRAADELIRDALNKMGFTHFNEDPGFRSMELSGGTMTTFADMDESSLIRVLDNVRSNLPQYSAGLRKVNNLVRDLAHMARVTGSVSENVNRKATFDNVKRQALESGMSELDANLKAAVTSAEAGVDFSKRGRAFEESKLIKGMDQGTAFWRATILGTDRVTRLFADVGREGLKFNPEGALKAVATTGASLTGMALLNYSYNRQNPDYFNISKNVRSRYLLVDVGSIGTQILQKFTGDADDPDKVFVQGGESLFLKVPVPHELGWLFMTSPVRVLEELDSANPFKQDNSVTRALGEGFDPIGDALLDLVGPVNPASPSFLGTGVGSIFQLSRNRDVFRDRPIENPHDELAGLPRELRGTGNESAAAEAISGTGFPLSPPQIDFLVRQIGGGTGGALLDAAGLLFGQDGEKQSLAESGPLRRFFVDERGKGQVGNDFYDEYFRLRGRIQSSKAFEDKGEIQKASRALQSLGEENIQKFHVMDAMYQDLRDLDNGITMTKNNEHITPERKRGVNDALRAEADFILKYATFKEEALPGLIERDHDPERRMLVQEYLNFLKAQDKVKQSIRRRIN